MLNRFSGPYVTSAEGLTDWPHQQMHEIRQSFTAHKFASRVLVVAGGLVVVVSIHSLVKNRH